MRIRTDGEFANRQDVIDEATDFYDRNKTESLLRAADDIPELVDGIVEVFERHDLSYQQRKELAEALPTRHFEFSWQMGPDEPVVEVEAESPTHTFWGRSSASVAAVVSPSGQVLSRIPPTLRDSRISRSSRR